MAQRKSQQIFRGRLADVFAIQPSNYDFGLMPNTVLQLHLSDLKSPFFLVYPTLQGDWKSSIAGLDFNCTQRSPCLNLIDCSFQL